jgi:hypothetical protein
MIDKRKVDDMITARAVVRYRLIGLRVMLPEADIGSALVRCGKDDADKQRWQCQDDCCRRDIVGFEDTADRNARHGEPSKI